jgi:hypothetical protein
VRIPSGIYFIFMLMTAAPVAAGIQFLLNGKVLSAIGALLILGSWMFCWARLIWFHRNLSRWLLILSSLTGIVVAAALSAEHHIAAEIIVGLSILLLVYLNLPHVRGWFLQARVPDEIVFPRGYLRPRDK